jgi:site-specific DNA-methyltransferase (adenine-specific)
LSPPAAALAVEAPRLERGDCIGFLDSLDASSVDVVATDPAYSGMNEKLMLGRGRIVGRYGDKGTADGKWFGEFRDTPENYRRFLEACRRVLAPGGHLYLMFDSFSLLTLGPVVREFFDVKNVITWDKVNAGMGHYFRRRHELVVFATNGNNRKLRHRSFPDVWRFKRIHRAGYPTQKPVEVFQAMVHASAAPGDLVCDPFMGSGSSAVAALRGGCRFAGCDVSPRAVRIARERVETFLATGEDVLQPHPASVPGQRVFWE